ncbi:hypothetical protein HC229_02880 [Flavobacterium sp. D33]|nr:hypothetical protein [Flavobacterium selenitireducens]
MKSTLTCVVVLIVQGLYAQSMTVRKDSFNIYFSRGEYVKALQCSDKALAHYAKERDLVEHCRLLIRRAAVFEKLGAGERAMETLYRALAASEESDDAILRAYVFKEMGKLYGNRLDNQAAIKNYHQGLALVKHIPNDSLEDDLVQGLFKFYRFSNRDSLKYYMAKANKFMTAKRTHEGYAIAHNNSFVYYITVGDTAKARKYLDTSIFHARKSNWQKMLVATLNNQAAMYYKENKFAEAKTYYDELLSLIAHDTTSSDKGDYYYTYSGILAGLGRYKEAYSYAEKSIELQDDLYGEEVNSALRDMKTKYALKEKDEKQGRERLVYLIVIAVFVISLILLYFFYQNNKLKQTNKIALIERETQQNLLSATLDAREVERKEIAAVLHDNISALLSSAGLQLMAFSSAQGNTSEEISKTRNILKEAHDKVRDLSHELVPTLLAKFGLAYALEDMCEKYSTPNLSFQYSDNGKVARYPEDFETKIYFITSELLNNALKHSKATIAKLDVNVEDGLNISLEDNGQGFDITKPDGFGLTQIKARISSMQGKVNVASKVGQGTTIKIWVPL